MKRKNFTSDYQQGNQAHRTGDYDMIRTIGYYDSDAEAAAIQAALDVLEV